jgi:nicotinamidase-related amidase
MTLPPEIAARISPATTALLVIDVQRRHLDVDGVGYHTLPPERAKQVSHRAADAVAWAREAGFPVVHVGTWGKAGARRPGKPASNPFFAWQNGKPITGASFVRQADKCSAGSVYAEFMPGTEPLPDEPLIVKFRYSGFYNTELEMVLHRYGITDLLVIGVNTNNCVLHTSFDAQARDFGVIVLEDCCGSMNGEEYHQMGLAQIGASIGWVSSLDEVASAVTGAQGAEKLATVDPR